MGIAEYDKVRVNGRDIHKQAIFMAMPEKVQTLNELL